MCSDSAYSQIRIYNIYIKYCKILARWAANKNQSVFTIVLVHYHCQLLLGHLTSVSSCYFIKFNLSYVNIRLSTYAHNIRYIHTHMYKHTYIYKYT